MSNRSEIGCTTARSAEVDTELIVVPVCETDDLSDTSDLDLATGGEVTRARTSGEFQGKPYEVFLAGVVDPTWRARRVALVGAGPRESVSTDRLRKLGVAVALVARQRRVGSLGFVLRGSVDHAEGVQAVAEGLTLGAFDDRRYKTTDDPTPLATCQILVQDDSRQLGEVAGRGRVLGQASNLARELVQEPGNILTPRVFADRASQVVESTGVAVHVLDEREIAKLQMGLLLGVARGSVEPPRLIVLRYEPAGAPGTPVLGLVGKGVTFDSGGISIKPAEGMDRMKDDMAGGAAVICAMRALAMLHAPIRVLAVVPMTENMPGGRAIKPGDVLIGASGKSVEVVNTDAEGRLILADALWYARELGATHLVDIATLTGSCVVALGKVASGLFGTPDRWVDLVRQTADRAGDRSWPLPLFDEYDEQLRSDIADLLNTGGRSAGACTAAMFLKEFTGGLPWAHLDIAGTAWCDEARPFQPKGASGVGVRTLAELAFTSERW